MSTCGSQIFGFYVPSEKLGEMADSRAGAAKVQDELGLFYYTTKYKRVMGTHPKDTETSLKGLPLAKYETI